jgi:hypothetical protein
MDQFSYSSSESELLEESLSMAIFSFTFEI